jgi:hypothetical protein
VCIAAMVWAHPMLTLVYGAIVGVAYGAFLWLVPSERRFVA